MLVFDDLIVNLGGGVQIPAQLAHSVLLDKYSADGMSWPL